MKEIKLTQGKIALVDDEDYEYLNQFKWRTVKGANTYYAQRMGRINGKRISIQMHNIILKPVDGLECDHINHLGFDNRKENLRNCTRSQNCMNAISHGEIEYKGVNRAHSKKEEYQARIMYHGRSYFLGHYKTKEDAAKAYDFAAKKYFGEFANLNFN
jgi:hypothetical protein